MADMQFENCLIKHTLKILSESVTQQNSNFSETRQVNENISLYIKHEYLCTKIHNAPSGKFGISYATFNSRPLPRCLLCCRNNKQN